MKKLLFISLLSIISCSKNSDESFDGPNGKFYVYKDVTTVNGNQTSVSYVGTCYAKTNFNFNESKVVLEAYSDCDNYITSYGTYNPEKKELLINSTIYTLTYTSDKVILHREDTIAGQPFETDTELRK